MNKTCEYCGQVVQATDNVEAWEVCRCREAIARQRQEAMINDAKEGVDRIFGEEAAEIGFKPLDVNVVEMIKAMVEDVGYGRIRAVTAQLCGGGTVTIKQGDGDIQVVRKEQKKAVA